MNIANPIDESELTPETRASIELSNQLTDEIVQLLVEKGGDIRLALSASMNVIFMATRQPVHAGDQEFCGEMAALLRAMASELEQSVGLTRN